MAATGTPTPNIGLRIPQGTDPASVDDINYNSNLIDTKLGAVGNDSVQDQIDSLNSKFVQYNGTKTSSATGLIKIMDGKPNATLTINCSPYIALPFYSNGAWYARIISDSTSFSPVTNTSIEYYANIVLA